VTPRLPLGPHPCNAFALTPGLPSSWPATLQPLCLGREPKARVATCVMTCPIAQQVQATLKNAQSLS